MSRPVRRLARVAVAALSAILLSSVAVSPPATADQPDGYGPSDPFDDSIMPDDGPQPKVTGHEALILRTAYGYRFISGAQDAQLRVKVVNGRLRFRDPGVRSWKSVPGSCKRLRVSPGSAASCRIPDDASTDSPLLLEIRPRLGNDRVDGRGLPARFDMAVLADAGRDTLFGGRGNDYLGGATDGDRSYGGAGKDWIRGGDGRDRLRGGLNGDWIVGMAGRDSLKGGAGKDRVFK
jgi:serralysin